MTGRCHLLSGAIAALLLMTAACDESALTRLPTADAGQRCRVAGQITRSDTHVLRCERRRYRRIATLDQARALIRSAGPTLPPGVLVVGDSFAMSLVPGLRVEALTSHATSGASGDVFEVISAGMAGCGVGRGGINRGIGLEREWPDACKNRDRFLQAVLGQTRPAVAVVAGGMWDVTDRRLAGDGAWRTVGDPTYDLYLVGEILHLVDLLAASGAKVVWTTAPRWNPAYTPALFMGPPPYPEAQPQRTDRLNELFRLALARRPGVQLIELAAYLQSLPGGEFGPGVRDDSGVHLSSETSTLVARWLMPQVLGRPG